MENNCAYCGAPLQKNEVFCKKCGYVNSCFNEKANLPPIEQVSWKKVLGIFFAAFLVLSVICFFI